MLNSYKLKVLVTGPQADEAKRGLGDLAEELQHRPWLLSPVVAWANNRIEVSLAYEAKTLLFARRAVGDEMLDCVTATIGNAHGLHVDVQQQE
jgi:hypothetical protein